MAALLTNADKNTSAATTAGSSGSHQVICSGNFTDGARCLIELSADSLDYALVHEFVRPGSIVLSALTGTTIRGSVVGGGDDTSIDVSVL